MGEATILAGGMDGQDEEHFLQESHVVASRRGWRAGLIAGAAGMAALVGVVGTVKWSVTSNLSGLQEKEERIQIEPSYPACSSPKENCYNTGRCKTSGHKCYTKGQGKAQCNETCTRGTCEVISPHSVPVARPLGQKLYCFAVYTQVTGNDTKVNHELELLEAAKGKQAGIFACDLWEVYSDGAASIGGYQAIQVNDEFNEFHQVKRKHTGTWVNWALFYQVWVGIRSSGMWEGADYTVKVDPDAVFLPDRLKTWLSTKPGDSPHGLYYENCPNVQYGFFGHIEVMTKTAVQVLTKYLENCHAEFGPCANTGCDWKWGAWGEDVFHSAAWIITTWIRWKLSIWRLMVPAGPTGQKGRRTIRNGQ